MKTRALGFLLMVAAAGVYAVGCGSSNNNGGTGGAGTGGKGGAAGAGAGGAGMGGKIGTGGAGMGGKMDAGTDTGGGTGGKMDGGTDMAADMTGGDVPADGQAAPTFTDVYNMILSTNADGAPGCVHCHDGVTNDAANPTLPHVMNFSTKAAAYAALVGVDSIRCPGVDGGAAIKRVLASNAAQSVLWQKTNQFVNPTQLACAPAAMPRNILTPNDGGATDAGDGGSVDAGFTQLTHFAITADQVKTIMDWINAGALDN